MPNAELRMPDEQPTAAGPIPYPIQHSAFVIRQFISRPVVGFAIAAAVPFVLYLLLLNKYWVRHGDSEVMISIARSLSRGQGFQVNGQPIGVVPPGWPAVLAAAMKFTTSFRTLKLLSIFSLIGFSVLSYDALTHVTRRRIALICVVLTALLQPVYFLSTVFFSDPLFCLLAMAWVCVALRIGTTRYFVPMLAALLLLAIATIAVRWAGAAWFLLIAPAIFHRAEISLKWSRRWLATILCAIVTVASFFVVRRIMHVDPKTLDWRYALFMQGTYDLFNIQNLPLQIQQFGLWLTGLFWSPSMWFRVVKIPSEIFGTLLFVVIVFGSWYAKRRQVWIIGGAMLYTFFLAADWPNPMSRYLIPAAPLLMAGVYEAMRKWRKLPIAALLALSVVLINGAIYINDLRVFRSTHFYSRYQGGGGASMIEAARALKEIDNGRPIFVSSKYYNFDKQRWSDGFRRAFMFLIDRPVLTDNSDMDDKYLDKSIYGEPNDHLVRMLGKFKAGWYLYCPPTKQFLHEDYSDPNVSTDWRLYQISNGRWKRIKLRPSKERLTHVPER